MDGDLEITELALDDRAGHEAYAALWSAVVPRYPITREELERRRARKPDDVRVIGRIDWAVAGCAAAIRSDLPGRTYMGNVVLPEYRGRGLGRALLERVVVAALGATGATSLRPGSRRGTRTASGSPRGSACARCCASSRSRVCSGRTSPIRARPRGSCSSSSRSGPTSSSDAYASREALPHMPLHAPLELPSYERWMDENATGPDVLEGGTLLALDGDRVVGFVSLLRRAADPHLAEHGLTSVAASHRSRGIATALKQAQIAWASRNGYRELMTSTQDANAPMRAVNDKLGYEQRPAWIRFEAPLRDVEAALAGDRVRHRT